MKGHIRQRSRGVWALVLDLGRDPQGKRRQKWHTVHGTKKDAERELARLIHELDTGGYVEPVRVRVSDYLEKWLADYARTNVSAKTYERYAQIVHNDLAPALGHYMLPKLQPLHIQDYYSQALRDGRKNGRGGLSAQTVLHHHRVLRQALHQAVRWQLLARNPADSVEPPRAVAKEMRVLDASEASALLASAEASVHYLPILLAITTGMRRGEILAVRWQDIDLDTDQPTLRVRRSIQDTRDGLTFKEPKTAKGRRGVILPELAVQALRRHKGVQAQQKLRMGQAYEDQGLVCAQDTGRPLSPKSVSSRFGDIVRRAGLPHTRFHDLRHTHATLLLSQGIHPKVVSERLGHSTVGMTPDVYSHVLPTLQGEAARKLDSALQAAAVNDRRSL